MPQNWAIFERDGIDLFRFDTRVYLNDVSEVRADDRAIGAIVAKNPGSARPSAKYEKMQPIALGKDQLLPAVLRIVDKAFALAAQQRPDRGYVQVFNLFYLCNQDLAAATRAIAKLDIGNCPGEKRSFPWLWYAWGELGEAMPIQAERFRKLKASQRFYLDHRQFNATAKRKGVMCSGHPKPGAFPKHTQGLGKNQWLSGSASSFARNSV